MLRATWVVALAALTLAPGGCSDDETAAAGAGGAGGSSSEIGVGGSGGATGAGGCASVGFAAEPVAWALPVYGQNALGAVSRSCSFPGELTSTIRDLDGDGLPELVIADDCDPGTALGVTEWAVHRNTGEGFAAEAIAWQLPPGFFGFPATGGDYCSSFAGPNFLLIALDGSAKPSLVVTWDCTDAEDVGVVRWLVYENTGTGFSPEATDWHLPAEHGPYRSASILDVDDTCPKGRGHALFPLVPGEPHGLVITSRCAEDSPVGIDHWLVYPSASGGFEDEPITWALPGTGLFSSLHANACDAGIGPNHTVRDVDGDGAIDLLVTSDCDPGSGVGDSKLLAYRNTGSAFADDAAELALPSGYAAGAFNRVSSYTCELAPAVWDLLNLDSALGPDVVVYDSCDGSDVGRSHWAVHLDEGGSFAPLPAAWHLPPGLGHVGSWFGGHCDGGVFSTTYLDGEAYFDLAITTSCGGEGAVGTERWDVYPSVCE